MLFPTLRKNKKSPPLKKNKTLPTHSPTDKNVLTEIVEKLKGMSLDRNEGQLVTRYIKNWADSAKFQVCSSHLTLCGLTVNRSEMPNFSYTHPLCVTFKDRTVPINKNQKIKTMADSVFSCSYCGTTITKNTSPNQSGCSAKSSHYWVRLGEVGDTNFQCKNCKIVVKTKSTPQQTGCTKASSHYWTRL